MKLRNFRIAQGLSQAKLAKKLGVTELSVLKYEQGRTIPSRAVMRRLFELSAGSVTPNDFYELPWPVMSNPREQFTPQAPDESRIVVGLMSGTSMDGIDAALIETDGVRYVRAIGSASLRYSAEFQSKLKEAERAVCDASGDLRHARRVFPRFDEVVRESTLLHARVTRELLTRVGHDASRVDLVGYHGQTLFHRPSMGITLQVGDGELLACELGIPVVCDFRSNDVRHGGQGAPFAPLYHEALALQMGLAPMVVANCGGISNISVITGRSEDLIAFDCGPGNGLIDRFVKARIGKSMDEDGVFGSAGRVHESVLAALRARGVISREGGNYLSKAPPKSLDINDLLLVEELESLSLQDGCATLEAFTAECIVESLSWVEARGIDVPTLWVLAGGGWRNPVITREVATRLRQRLGDGVRVQHADAVGWDGTALEAQIFAYLAVRSARGLPLSVPGTTGVPEPITGGCLCPVTR